MKSYIILTTLMYLCELFIIGTIIGGIYYFTKHILNNIELVPSIIGIFIAGFITHHYLSMKWKFYIEKKEEKKCKLKH